MFFLNFILFHTKVDKLLLSARYNTVWNSIPGSYYQLNAAFFKGFWIANLVENAAYVLNFVDSEGRPLNGRNDYKITFKTPPPSQGAFSSLQVRLKTHVCE